MESVLPEKRKWIAEGSGGRRRFLFLDGVDSESPERAPRGLLETTEPQGEEP
jgi:hypothetical protein